MNFLNKATQQITDLFQQMTPAARITAGLLLVTIVCSLFFLFRGQAGLADEYLFGGDAFSQKDLAVMEAAFAKAGLKASQIEGSRMKVPRGTKNVYIKSLVDNQAMPENYLSPMDKAIKDDSPFAATQHRTNVFRIAKENELARVVRTMKGIEDASVMYDETMSGSFPRRMERRASVSARAVGSRHLSDEEIKTIRNLVVGAVGSLKTSDVTIVDLNANRAYPGGDGNSVSATDNPYAITKRMFEETYREKIATRLSMYPGIVVGVNVELDPDLSQSIESVELKGKPVEVESTSFEKSTPAISNNIGGRPGANPNGVGPGNTPQQISTQVAASDPATETRTEKRMTNSQQRTSTQKASLVPNRVTASIDIPSTYFVKVWKEKNPPDKDAKDDKKPDPAELKRIEDETKINIETAVASILPPAGLNQKLVTVTSFTDLPTPPLPTPSVTQHATSWLAGNWQTLAMIGMALVSLLFLKGMINSVPPEPSIVNEAAGPGLKIAQTGGDEEHEDEEKGRDPKRKFKTTGPNLRAELANLVKEDPETAANILRSWIGEVA